MNPINPSGVPNPSPNIWPPPPTGANPYEQEQENTSGQNTSVPPQIAALKWNWGAALLPFWWLLNHRLVWWAVGIFVLSCIPYVGYFVGLAALIYFGINGHRLAWQNRRFEGGLPQYFAVQKAWLNWAVGFFVVSLVITPFLAAILFPVFAKARAKARATSGYYGRMIELPRPAHKPTAHR